MNPSDPLQDALEKLEAPHLPQQSIDSFLNEALRKANVAANLAGISGDISKHIASMTSAGDWSRQLLRSFELPKSPIQRIIDETARMAAVHRNLSSLTDTIEKATASLRTSADLSRELLRPFEIPKSLMQMTIEAAQTAAMRLDFNRLNEQMQGIARLAQLYSRPQFGGLSQVIQQALAASRIWQSAHFTDFASRVISEPEFRQAVIERLESEELPGGQAADSRISSQEILEAVERGIEESGAVRHSDNIQASVDRMFSWWAKLPPDLRTLAITLLAGLLLLVAEYDYFVKDQPTSQLPVNQRVKIVQKITNNIFVNVGVSPEERRQFRVVTKDELSVFRSNRRDSGKIGSLTAGQVVTVRLQKRSWTQIEWKDTASQETRTGWVFTRYLKKIWAH